VRINRITVGVQFIDMQNLAGSSLDFNIAYFRGTEGNLLSLEYEGVDA